MEFLQDERIGHFSPHTSMLREREVAHPVPYQGHFTAKHSTIAAMCCDLEDDDTCPPPLFPNSLYYLIWEHKNMVSPKHTVPSDITCSKSSDTIGTTSCVTTVTMLEIYSLRVNGLNGSFPSSLSIVWSSFWET